MKLGRYQTIEEIGRGGMGVVYRAKDPNIGRDVALKILDASRLVEPELSRRLKRFTREAKVAGNLHHPAIVTIYDAAVDPISRTPYIAMEFVPGIDLATILQGAGALPPRQAMSILYQVADALDYAHDEGVIHRDIKPANILLTDRGDANVLDFGIAKLASDTSLTQVGKMIGTPGYTSPEQIEGTTVDYRSDNYGLALLAWELLSGVPPFQGDSGVSLSYKILHQPPPDIPDLPPAAMAVLRKGIARDKARRYSRATEFVSDLAMALDVPLPPRSPSGRIVAPTFDAPRSSRPEAAIILAAGVLFVATLMLGLYAVSVGMGKARKGTPPVVTRTTPRSIPKKSPQFTHRFGRVKVNIRIEGTTTGRVIIEVDGHRHAPIPISHGRLIEERGASSVVSLSKWLRLKEGSRRFGILIEAGGRTVRTNNLRIDLRAGHTIDLNVAAVLSKKRPRTTITVRPHAQRKGSREDGSGSPPPSRGSASHPLPRS